MAMKHFTAVNTLLMSTKRTPKKGGEAKVKFQLTAKISTALEWPEMPDGTAEWCPDIAELKAGNIEFIPNNPEVSHNATSIDADSIGDFVVVRKQQKEGKNSKRAAKTLTEVLCTIKFSDPTGCAKLEQYMQGAKRSEMRVSYTPQPKQDELPGTRVDMTPESSQLPLASQEQIDAKKDIESDPNVEYVARAKERLEAKRGPGRPRKEPVN